VGVGKPLGLAAGRETDARARGHTEGAPAANTCKDGLLGNMYRAKYTTTGTGDKRTAAITESCRVCLRTDIGTADCFRSQLSHAPRLVLSRQLDVLGLSQFRSAIGF